MAESKQGADRPAPRQKQTTILLRALAASAALAVLVACGPGAAPSPSPSPTTTSSTPTPTPSPSPSDEPTPDSTPTPDDTDDDPNDRSELLEQPEAMENDDEEGAIAAAKYFMGLFEYVYLTGDLEAWSAMALPECEFCAVIAADVSAIHEAGGRMVSGPPEWLGEPETRQVVTTGMWSVTLRAEVSATTTYDADDKVIEETPQGYTKAKVGVIHDGTDWRTLNVTVSGED